MFVCVGVLGVRTSSCVLAQGTQAQFLESSVSLLCACVQTCQRASIFRYEELYVCTCSMQYSRNQTAITCCWGASAWYSALYTFEINIIPCWGDRHPPTRERTDVSANMTEKGFTAVAYIPKRSHIHTNTH